mgnify:FL=1
MKITLDNPAIRSAICQYLKENGINIENATVNISIAFFRETPAGQSNSVLAIWGWIRGRRESD